MTKISPSELNSHFESEGIDNVNISQCLGIIDNLNSKRISQIIFDFGIETLQSLSRFLKDREDYEVLAVIRDKLKIHNRVAQKNYNLE